MSPSAASTPAPAPSKTPTTQPSVTLLPGPSPSPTALILPLEIVEWAEFGIPDAADPNNADTQIQMLARNPNQFPVRVPGSGVELRFLNAAGEVVYTNPNPVFYIWQGSWILGGETTSLSACVCFATDGVPRRNWSTLELVVPLTAETEVAYTDDVEVTLGEFFSLAEAHLGGDEQGAEITVTNTSDQVLQSVEVRIIARDAGGKYVGVVTYGGFSDSGMTPGSSQPIEPGASGSGIIVSEINYYDQPMTYEIFALGILAGP